MDAREGKNERGCSRARGSRPVHPGGWNLGLPLGSSVAYLLKQNIYEEIKMSKRWFLWRALAALSFVGLLIVGGLAIYYLGWSQGYGTGPLATPGEAEAPLPYWPHGPGYIGRPFAFAMCTGLIFKLGMLLLLFCIIGKVFRFFAWGMVGGPWLRGGPWGRQWARRWHRHHHHPSPPYPHGPMPPWCWDWEQPSDEETGDAEPSTDANSTEI